MLAKKKKTVAGNAQARERQLLGPGAKKIKKKKGRPIGTRGGNTGRGWCGGE